MPRRVGTWLMVLIVVAVALAFGYALALNTAATDIRQTVQVARGNIAESPPSPVGAWLAAQFSSDLVSTATDALAARADSLDHRAERIREVAAMGAFTGLLLGLLTGRPATAATLRAPLESSGAAKTTSSGSV